MRILVMKKVWLALCGVLYVLSLRADHIVGGELEFITIEPGRYRINLIQYRDDAQQENNVIIDTYTVYVFANSDGPDASPVSRHELNRVSYDEVPYTKPECAVAQLKTGRVVWTGEFDLDPKAYADPEGYYIVWERCCRNRVIKNIVNPEHTGMKYVLEIPPLWKDGARFINSSPELLKPLSDYACVNQLYYTSFTGTDRDGDSLVYRLATPLNSSSQRPLPLPQPKPHIPIEWADGYSLENVISGKQPLSISPKGLLLVNPSSTGVYVFSVMVEEWRDQQKIGEVQRDFQMLAIDGCNPPEPPEVGVKIPGNEGFDPEVDTLKYSVHEDKCFEFIITNITAGETISLRAEPVNFEGPIEDVFSIEQQYVGDGVDTLIVQFCAPGCPPLREEPFIVDLIAGDDACPLPQMDTVRLTIFVEPPANDLPVMDAVGPQFVIDEDSLLEVNLRATDADGDSMYFELLVEGAENPADRGFSLVTRSSESGLLTGSLYWDTNCEAYDFKDQQHFRVGILAEDLDTCSVPNDPVWLDMEVVLPFNSAPEVILSVSDTVEVRAGEILAFDVLAEDQDGDTLFLRGYADGFDQALVGAVFNDTSGVGEVESPFSWLIDCKNLVLGKEYYRFLFVAEDQDRCEVVNEDTLALVVRVDLAENLQPEFMQVPDTALEVNVPFEMDLRALDANSGDSVGITFLNPARLPRSPTLSLEEKVGFREVTATFQWTPDCSLLDLGETSASYDIIFLAYDNGCPLQKFDTMKVTFEVRETRERFDRFLPPNVFTPNGDGKNDTFTLTNLPRGEQNLPPDNCEDAFEYFAVQDRNGTTVFESASREFVWDGANVEAGVYYYVVKYTRTSYKGYLHVMR